jgi:membrane protease YdiL (CAAX protease family)
MRALIHLQSGKIWKRIPVLFRSIVTGFLVSTLGITIWTINFTFVPQPWFLISMLIPLWLFWKFFSGRIPQNRSSASRARLFRSVWLSGKVWKWGLAAAALFVLIIQFSFIISFRLLVMPSGYASGYRIVETMPRCLAFLTIGMSSVVAGICEETGFRGYMQVPLEKRYGMLPAILIVSVIFTLIHIDQVWAAPVLPNIFIASLLLGLLASKSGSLIPGIIAHSILDVFDYSFWWTNLMGKWKQNTIFSTGLDLHFAGSLVIFALALFGFFWVLDKIDIRKPPLTGEKNFPGLEYSR